MQCQDCGALVSWTVIKAMLDADDEAICPACGSPSLDLADEAA